MWHYVQLAQWQQLIARCVNVQRGLLKLGAKSMRAADADTGEAPPAEQSAEEIEAAEGLFRQALDLGRHVGSAEPNLFVTVWQGMEMMQNAYEGLAGAAALAGSGDLQRWDGEIGVLAIGRVQLHAALQQYEKRRGEDPPVSIAELLSFEARLVKPIMAGIDLTPSAPEGESEQRAREASTS
jgi:hypothetical protein